MTSSFVQHGCTLRGGITTIAGFVLGTCAVQSGTGMLEIIAKQGHLLLERPSESAVVLSRIAFLREKVFKIVIFQKDWRICPLCTNGRIGCQNDTSVRLR